MGKRKPKAPDPYETAQAQGQMNRDTAISQQLVNMIGQDNPWGSTSYDQTGTISFVDGSGNRVSIPQFTQTTTLSPEQQRLLESTQGVQQNLADIAGAQSERVSDALSNPFEFTNQDAADWAYDLASSRIMPQQERNEEALRTRLINSGLRPGTQAWNSEMERMTNANTDQMNQLMLQGRSQAFGENMAVRNQPLNELMAMLGGTQVVNPAGQSAPTPQAGVGGVDYTGLVNQQYQQQMQNRQAGLGGLFGLAGSVLGGIF